MNAQQVADMLHPAITLEQLQSCFNSSTAEADIDAFLSRGSGPYAEAVAATAQAAALASPHVDDDASLALAVQLQMDAEEEERCAKISMPAGRFSDEDASVALALKLQMDEDAMVKREAKRRPSERRGEALRDHLFFSGGAAAGAPSQLASQPTPPPPIACSNVRSYAAVTGAGDPRGSARSSEVLGTVPAARQLLMAAATPVPRPPPARRPPVLVIDGANVAYNYSRDARFDARGIRLCVDYYLQRPSGRRLDAGELAVVLNEGRWDALDPELTYLHQLGCITLTPTGKYDDLFLLQCCADHNAWALTNDAWREARAARHATEAVRRRTIRFAFCGDSFTPAADDLARFDERARR